MLKSGIICAVPGEVCVLLEQLMQEGSQGGQTRDEGTKVSEQASRSSFMFVGAGKVCTALTFPGFGWTPLAL